MWPHSDNLFHKGVSSHKSTVCTFLCLSSIWVTNGRVNVIISGKMNDESGTWKMQFKFRRPKSFFSQNDWFSLFYHLKVHLLTIFWMKSERQTREDEKCHQIENDWSHFIEGKNKLKENLRRHYQKQKIFLPHKNV